jgi:hypothetical protein
MLQNIKIGSFYNQSSYMTMFYVVVSSSLYYCAVKSTMKSTAIPLWKAVNHVRQQFGSATPPTSLISVLKTNAEFSCYSWYGAVSSCRWQFLVISVY